MGYSYRPSQNDFFLFSSANEIREGQYGNDLNERIHYPGVSSCTTITVVLQDNSALGMHFTIYDPVNDVDAIIAQVNVVRAGRVVRDIYMVGVLQAVGAGWKNVARYVWPTQKATINTAFGRNAADVIQGYLQAANTERDYRVLIGNGGATFWTARDTRHGAGLIHPWEQVTMGPV